MYITAYKDTFSFYQRLYPQIVHLFHNTAHSNVNEAEMKRIEREIEKLEGFQLNMRMLKMFKR